MGQSTHRPARAFAGVALAALTAAALAACGSSGSTGTTTNPKAGAGIGAYGAGESTGSAVKTSTPTAAAVMISTAHGSAGTYLVGTSGRAIYLWEGDKGDASSCSGSCATNWPPVTTKGSPQAGTGVAAHQLATIKGSGGVTQVTYNGHPLYYFVGDPSSGTTTGQGSDAFGAKWWLVSPAGVAVGAKAAVPVGTVTSASGTSTAGGSWG